MIHTDETDSQQQPAAKEEPLTKEVGVQTKYRDSEAQTIPYTPEPREIKEDAGELEILLLTGMTFANGFDLGVKEIEMIENARLKRALEASLPPATDEASLNLRKQLLEMQETKEYDLRVKEMDDAHERRIQVLKSAMEERDEGNAYLSDQRIAALQQQKMEEKEKAIEALHAKKMKVLRKLHKTRQKLLPLESGRKKRNIIQEYSDFSSEVYAPTKRDGRLQPTPAVGKLDVAKTLAPQHDPLSYLQNMQSTLPGHLTTTKIRTPVVNDHLEATAARRAFKFTKNLQKVDELANLSRTGESGSPKKPELPAWRTVVSTATRPPTPDIASAPDREAVDGDVKDAIMLLQRLLRGRRVQNAIFQGKEKRKELIDELRAVDEEVPDDRGEEADEVRRACITKGSVDTIAGVVVTNMLDFFSKEYARQQEKEKLDKMSMGAAHLRKRRELEETGRRQATEHMRAREDEVYRQVVKTNFDSASTLVDSVIEATVDETARGTAMKELTSNPEMAQSLAAASEGTPRTVNDMTRDVVASYLLPAVEEVQEKNKEAEEDVRFTDAAHKTIDETTRHD